ncbi:MAG TPA: alpha/beta hydrolase [Streptosporangiaceae bacterium]|nr:alpha/beta hydrolase [Streptosporangiaceae bacterium]
MRVSIGDVLLYFDVDGCGLMASGASMRARPSLVLLHGGPGADHTFFKPEFGALADVGQVVYLDQRGSGRSDRASAAEWTWDRWADDVAAFCAALGIGRPVLVGTSSGGLVAMQCAARHPALVAGLVLDSSFGAPMTEQESLDVIGRRGGPAAREAASTYFGGDQGPAAAQAWERLVLPLYASGTRSDLAERRARAMVSDDVQQHFRRGGCGPAEIGERAAAITCPVLILAGNDDPVVPVAASRRLAALLTQAPVRLEILDGVGHGVVRQVPDRGLALVREFVATLAPPPH